MLAAGAVAATALPAKASPLAASLPAVVLPTGLEECSTAAPASGLPVAIPLEAGKAAAILGGQVSALDRIRMQQAQSDSQGLIASDPAATIAAAAPERVCAVSFAHLQPALPVAAAMPAGGAEIFLASERVPIGQTQFNDDWRRVSQADFSAAQLSAIGWTRSAPSLELMGQVNAWVNAAIAYTEDADQFDRRDYWASAPDTMRSRRGDCEDLAILKYQLLRALGFDPRDMYLTLANDQVRRADHAVLVVRQDGAFHMLDNATDTVLPADRNYDYRPILSFAAHGTWLHGYPAAQQRQELAYLSVSAISNPREIGLNR